MSFYNEAGLANCQFIINEAGQQQLLYASIDQPEGALRAGGNACRTRLCKRPAPVLQQK